MDSFTIGNAKPSNMSRNLQNTDARRAKTMLLSICGQSVGFPRNKAPGAKCCWICGQGHTAVWPSRVIDLPGPLMVEQCVQSWTERESFLRSGEYNALAGSQIKLVCFS